METKTDYLNNLCEIFQKDIETRKSIQDEGGKPESNKNNNYSFLKWVSMQINFCKKAYAR